MRKKVQNKDRDIESKSVGERVRDIDRKKGRGGDKNTLQLRIISIPIARYLASNQLPPT